MRNIGLLTGKDSYSLKQCVEIISNHLRADEASFYHIIPTHIYSYSTAPEHSGSANLKWELTPPPQQRQCQNMKDSCILFY